MEIGYSNSLILLLAKFIKIEIYVSFRCAKEGSVIVQKKLDVEFSTVLQFNHFKIGFF